MPRFTVGLTGGLASGKSTVLKLFEKLGIETLSADKIVHELMHKTTPFYKDIINQFGQEILDANQEIDRKKLRNIVFNSLEKKKWLEEYIHPLVRKTLWEKGQALTSPYVMLEIPLLVENQADYAWINRILVIDCHPSLQQERALIRSHLSYEESNAIIKQQARREKRNEIADDILLNEGNIESLTVNIKKLHLVYLELALAARDDKVVTAKSIQ